MVACHRRKNVFTFFILVMFSSFFNVFILSTFFIFKYRWQNRRVSKRKNGNEIIQFNNIIHFQESINRNGAINNPVASFLLTYLMYRLVRLYLRECRIQWAANTEVLHLTHFLVF